MRALSIRQPWAWLIIAGYKDIENRTRQTEIRGEFLIHAGKEIDKAAHDALMAGRHPVTGAPSNLRLVYPPALSHELDCGGVVGIAELTGCVSGSQSEWFQGPYGYVLRNARTLRFQPCAGMLGWFTPDRDIDIRSDAAGEGQGRLI